MILLKSRQAFVALSLLFLLSLSIAAHDYWLEPVEFFVSAGGSVVVRMHLGDHLKSEEERPYKASSTARFEMFSATGRKDLSALASDGETPVANLTFETPGTYLLAMERKPQTITLAAEKFTEYLKEEGLDSIIEHRARAGESEAFGRERYSRYLKSLLQVGDRRDDTFKRNAGHLLELIPQRNPYELKSGQTLKLQVLFQGQPLPDATVFAYHRAEGKVYTQKLRTARDGSINVKLERAGQWLVRMVHMRRCAKCEDIDWESFWTALSFGVR